MEVNLIKPIMSSVHESAQYIALNSKSVSVNSAAITKVAKEILPTLLSTQSKDETTLQLDPLEPPGMTDEEVLEWTFLLDTLNFCFWSDQQTLFTVNYHGVKWTGYRSLCAALLRAKEEGIPVHKPSFYGNVTVEQLKHIFRSDTHVQLPLMEERCRNLHEAATVLNEKFNGRVSELIERSSKSAQKLVQLLAENFSSYNDTAVYKGKQVYLLKRAQIFAADVWDRFSGKGFGEFYDIDTLTMFADYRVPQALLYFGILSYDESLFEKLQKRIHLDPGSEEEVEIRGCSVWAVELLKVPVEMQLQAQPSIKPRVNSASIDFFLWKFAKSHAEDMQHLPIHRTRTIFY